jgi:phage terminase large subunit-like protein
VKAIAGDYYFDQKAAKRVCQFFERFLCHWKGSKAGQPFRLLAWQRQVLSDLFGWKRTADGTRRYRTAYIEVPRKNGKTLFISGILLYLLCGDDEPGAEVYAVANTRAQAGVAFKDCRSMVAASPALSKRLLLKQHTIEHPASNSVLASLSGESVGSHGKNIHGMSMDELHELKSQSGRDLYEALTTSMGARSQPLVIQITTAGNGGDDTICSQQHAKAMRYLSGEIVEGDDAYDDTFYACVYAADPSDDWTDPATWAKANPSLGEAVSEDYLRRECVKAKESPANENSFRRLYLNQWTETTTRWLKLDAFDACVRPVEASEVNGLACFVGTDLSTTYDMTAVVALYVAADGTWLVVPRLYIPRETARRRAREDGTPFPEWAEQGHVIETPGQTIDYAKIEADVRALAAGGRVREVAFDPFNAVRLMGDLDRSGITTVPVQQNFLGMSAACKEVERRMADRTIVFDLNPCLRWMASSVEVEFDRHMNLRPVKPNRRGSYAGTAKYSIDGIVATIVAASRAMRHDPTTDEADSAGNGLIIL